MSHAKYSHCTFLTSAATLRDLTPDKGAEVAFIGRSNAGKSSAINTITGIRGLARISKTPGRTQLINLFALADDSQRIVDLPGYGYAKVPVAIKERWQKTVNAYLQKRQCLRGLVLVMDIRHPLKELDQQLIMWAVDCHLPVHILLTKADKMKRGPAMTTLQQVKLALAEFEQWVSVQIFSSLNETGLQEVHEQLDVWLGDKGIDNE